MFPKSAVFPLIGDAKTKINGDLQRIADKALRNIIEPFPKYPDIAFGANFNWDHQEPELATSYSLYLQNLRVVGTLLAVYEHSKNTALLDKCDEILQSWLNYVEAGGQTEMTWYDHAVGARCRVLTQYLAICEEVGRSYDKKRFTSILEKHATILMDDSHHRMNNHGIMMDNALISLGIGLQRMDFFYHGMERVKAIFWQTFSETGMHQENSPEYHSMVQRMFNELELFLKANGFSLGKDVLRKLQVVSLHRKRLVKPDGKIPAIGDSSHRAAESTYNWDSFHDQMSGFSILKEEQLELYLAFICGFSATAHKHSDDLSVILNYGKKDFFVDAGKYNYGKNRFRSFVVSRVAHSSFTVDRSYKRDPENRYTKQIATDHFLDSKLYSLASGYNLGYDAAALRRSVYVIPEQSLIVINDQGQNLENRRENWQQRFTLSPQATARLLNENTIEVTNGDKTIYLKWNSKSRPLIEVIDKSDGKVFVSENTKSTTPTSQIVISHASSTEFDGVISISLGKEFTGGIEVDRNSQIIRVIRESDSESTSLMLPRFSL